MDKIQRSRPPRQRSFFTAHPFLKGLLITLFCFLLIAVGYLAASAINAIIEYFII